MNAALIDAMRREAARCDDRSAGFKLTGDNIADFNNRHTAELLRKTVEWLKCV